MKKICLLLTIILSLLIILPSTFAIATIYPLTCTEKSCNLSDDYGVPFVNLSFDGTTGFDDFIDDDTIFGQNASLYDTHRAIDNYTLIEVGGITQVNTSFLNSTTIQILLNYYTRTESNTTWNQLFDIYFYDTNISDTHRAIDNYTLIEVGGITQANTSFLNSTTIQILLDYHTRTESNTTWKQLFDIYFYDTNISNTHRAIDNYTLIEVGGTTQANTSLQNATIDQKLLPYGTNLERNKTWNDLNNFSSYLVVLYFNATQSSVVAGTIDGGSLTNTQHSDGNYDDSAFNFSEEAGSPALDLRMNFTSVSAFNGGVMRYKTSSLAGEFPIIQLWNYDESAWGDYPSVPESSTFATIQQPVYDPSEHILNNVIQMRLYKASSGNINNHYYVDWLAVSRGFGTPSSEEVDPIWSADKSDYYTRTESNTTWNQLFDIYFYDTNISNTHISIDNYTIIKVGETAQVNTSLLNATMDQRDDDTIVAINCTDYVSEWNDLVAKTNATEDLGTRDLRWNNIWGSRAYLDEILANNVTATYGKFANMLTRTESNKTWSDLNNISDYLTNYGTNSERNDTVEQYLVDYGTNSERNKTWNDLNNMSDYDTDTIFDQNCTLYTQAWNTIVPASNATKSLGSRDFSWLIGWFSSLWADTIQANNMTAGFIRSTGNAEVEENMTIGNIKIVHNSTTTAIITNGKFLCIGNCTIVKT